MNPRSSTAANHKLLLVIGYWSLVIGQSIWDFGLAILDCSSIQNLKSKI
ncbi:hypothetical protein NSP_1980 [Nodularia spumigena CCY9414]|nr:hypothetical protein NSP_1980 [Nodularia spumigena CCY9414]